MVRTDFNEQKLEKFFGNTVKKCDAKPAEPPTASNAPEADDHENAGINDESLVEDLNSTEKNQNFENMLMNKTTVNQTSAKTSNKSVVKASLISRISK